MEGTPTPKVGVVTFYYRPQRSWDKVIFSQACVCPRGGSASAHAGIYPPPPGPGPDPPRADTPPGPDPLDQTPSPGSRLQRTVNERPVRILLECILVWQSLAPLRIRQ